MRIFLAGATGAVGTRLVPVLVNAGHSVVGTTRSAGKADALRQTGAEPVVMDGLDREAVLAAVTAAEADVVVHQLTALAGMGNPRKFDEEFAATNRLRTDGTDNLLAAARATGAKRFVAQSYTGWPNERTGGPVKTEEDPLDPHPTKASRRTLAAIEYLESTVAEAVGLDGVVLRYGSFYGPGTGLHAGGDLLEMIRRRRFPVVAGGRGVFSFVHIDDAATATLAAIERGAPGIYNIVDDDPAPVVEWLPYLAEVIGAKSPLRLPGWLARPVLGEHGMAMMTTVRGASNAKAKRELDWRPAYPSWRQGFRTGLG
ncbi:MAG TPA: NAD(P)-dependent oxidoreductase [Jiangellaceae bacterium]|nr:NAD(P)-dependent oxidoreductase [Jiangellaceae bacterium]